MDKKQYDLLDKILSSDIITDRSVVVNRKTFGKNVIHKEHKNIQEMILDIKSDFLSRIYNSNDGNMIFDICSGTEFDNGDQLEENIWNAYDTFMRNNTLNIFKWCVDNYEVPEGKTDFECTRLFVDQYSARGSMYSWMRYKQIYKFSKEMTLGLLNTSMKSISWDYFSNIPYNDIYIDISDAYEDFNGCFIHVNYNSFVKVHTTNTLTITFVDNKCSSTVLTVYIDVPVDQEIPYVYIYNTADLGDSKELINEIVEVVLKGIIYLTVQDNDIEEGEKITTNHYYTNKKNKRVKKVVSSTVWNVGYREVPYSNKATKSTQVKTPTGRTVRPHIRRKHYHLYWTGPKGNKKPVVHLLDATFVKCNDATNLPTVAHIIK